MVKARKEDFEKNFVKEIVIVAKEMGGWSIDDILDMPITRYSGVRNALKEIYEEQRKELEFHKNRNTFR